MARAKDIDIGFADYRATSLRVFGWGQTVGVLGTFGFLAVLFFTNFDRPLLLALLGLNTITGVGGLGALFLLARNQVRLANLVFVLMTVIAISLTLPIAGAGSGAAATYVWPVACAAMLMGNRGGIIIAALCSTILLGEYGLETTGLLVPQLGGELAQYVAVFAALLALALATIVTTVAGGSIRRSLSDAQAELSERRRAEQALRESETQFRAVFENTLDAMFIVDEQYKCIDVNPAAATLTMYSREDLLKNCLDDIAAAAQSGLIEQLIGEASRAAAAVGELQIRRADGQIREVAYATSPDFMLGFHLIVLRDVTERKQLEQQLIHQAFHDTLTNLPNRALFMDRMAHALERAQRRGEQVAVLFLDLDEFKVINDTLGHQTGDLLLMEVGLRVRQCARSEDTVARLGGDEFTVLLENILSGDDAAFISARIIERLRQPFNLNGREVQVNTSIGIALSSPENDEPEELLRKADIAMYEAKNRGKGRYEVFDLAMSFRAWKRLNTETDLRRALEEQQFVVYYQPLIDLATGAMSGVEALVRWQHPQLGMVSPAEFIPVAEQTGMILPLGQWVLEQSCQQMAAWHKQFNLSSELSVSVNLSARQLQNPSLLADIGKALVKSGLEPACLLLEITESMALDDVHSTVVTLQELKQLGVRIVMDDFGTGYSALSYLKRYPIDSLKLDRSFVKDLGDDPANAAIVNAIVAFARTLKLTVTAEGIETIEQLDLLRTLGCDSGQGYYFSRPLPAETFVDFLTAHYKVHEPLAGT